MTQRTAPDAPLIRSAQIRAEGTSEAMEFTGIGVPFGESITVSDWFGRHSEEFEPGSIELAETGAKIYWRHGEIIGRVISNRDTDQGHEITGKISDTTLGRDAYTMLRDGTIDRLSIGFQPLEWREDDEGHITYTKVRAVEFSLVPNPAYPTAAISEVRHQTTPQKEDTMLTDALTREALTPIEQSLEDLQREMKLLSTKGPATPDGEQFRSMGGLLKALSRGDDAALEFHRAYTGATTADTVMKPAFLGDYVKLVDERRKIVNQFTRGTLPADGMSVDYFQLEADNTAVGEQANEGDDLIYGSLKLKEANAPVKTYGGWTELSRQAIERATVPALNITLRAMALRYAKVTNVAVATMYANVIAEHLAAFNDDTAPNDKAAVSLEAGADATAWLNMIVDAALRYEERGFQIQGLNVTADVFKTLNGLKDGDRRLMRVYGDGNNQVGELNLTQVSGNLGGVTVSLLPNTSGQVAAFYDPVAIETLESPNAPAQLQDDNIINLSKQFSVYGYQAVLAPFKEAILPIDFEA